MQNASLVDEQIPQSVSRLDHQDEWTDVSHHAFHKNALRGNILLLFGGLQKTSKKHSKFSEGAIFQVGASVNLLQQATPERPILKTETDEVQLDVSSTQPQQHRRQTGVDGSRTAAAA